MAKLQSKNKMVIEAENKTYLTPAEVANLLMVSTAAVRRWAAERELRALTTPGGHRRFLPEDVEDFITKRTKNGNSEDPKGLRVLIVDNDKKLSSYLMKMLGKYPEKILPDLAVNGYEAGIKVYDFNPDVVLLDLMMPGINGFQVCESLKGSSATKEIRVIAMTEYPSAENSIRIIKAGAEACIPKPINKNKLLELLDVRV